jgi:LacI family transcriptional regulator
MASCDGAAGQDGRATGHQFPRDRSPATLNGFAHGREGSSGSTGTATDLPPRWGPFAGVAVWSPPPGKIDRRNRTDGSAGETMTTIHDVAREAGVSAATVSRVLNGNEDVNAEMAARVLEAVRTLGYRPNGVARSLRRQATQVWALIISDIENPHFTALVRGVEDVARANGFSVVLCNSDEDADQESRYLDVALSNRVSGLILSPSTGDTNVTPLLERGTPVVTIDRTLNRTDVPAVVVDNEAAARGATEHLIEAGYRRIGCVTGPLHTSTAEQRLAGYRSAVSSSPHGYDPALVKVENYKEDGGHRAVRELLTSDDPPDALFVANSLMTMGALEALVEQRVAIPDQMGLIGFDDSPWLRLMRPSLSVVAQPTYEIGRRAAQLLLATDGPPTVETLTTTLITRDSSKRAQPPIVRESAEGPKAR